MRFLKVGLGFVSAIGILSFGLLAVGQNAAAQDSGQQSFLVYAGGYGAGNSEIHTFMPSKLQVHQGDSVTWLVNGFHDIHFEDTIALEDFVIAPEVDGRPRPQFNPAFAQSSLESGSSYTGGESSSGFPTLDTEVYHPKTYSLTIDAAPGVYTYVSHLQSGMIGTIEVVADDVAIPNPGEAALSGAVEYSDLISKTLDTYESDMKNQTPGQRNDNGTVTILAGTPGSVTVEQYFPTVAFINVGDTVTWMNPPGATDAQTVASLDFEGNAFDLQSSDGKPMVAFSTAYDPIVVSGGSIGLGDTFNSGLLLSGQTYSLTFTEGGIYPYYSHFHPGMKGVIVVEPKA